MPDTPVADVADYYRSILPFYELESVSRAAPSSSRPTSAARSHAACST